MKASDSESDQCSQMIHCLAGMGWAPELHFVVPSLIERSPTIRSPQKTGGLFNNTSLHDPFGAEDTMDTPQALTSQEASGIFGIWGMPAETMSLEFPVTVLGAVDTALETTILDVLPVIESGEPVVLDVSEVENMLANGCTETVFGETSGFYQQSDDNEKLPDSDECLLSPGCDLATSDLFDAEEFTDFSFLLQGIDWNSVKCTEQPLPPPTEPAPVVIIAPVTEEVQSLVAMTLSDCDHTYYNMPKRRCTRGSTAASTEADDDELGAHDRYLERRRKNNIASKRSRENRKARDAKKKEDADVLSVQNDQMRLCIAELQRWVDVMKNGLVGHLKSQK